MIISVCENIYNETMQLYRCITTAKRIFLSKGFNIQNKFCSSSHHQSLKIYTRSGNFDANTSKYVKDNTEQIKILRSGVHVHVTFDWVL